MSLAVEITVEDLEGLEIAARAGAHRVELAVDLDQGGRTPPTDLVARAVGRARSLVAAQEARPGFAVHSLVRPTASTGSFLDRPEEFRADDEEVRGMAQQAADLVRAGSAGVVLGVLDAHGELDVVALETIRDAALVAAGSELRGLDLTLHRAVDAMASPDIREESVRTALRLGFHRILTSGGAARALDGAADLTRMVHAAEGIVEIMAGGGVRPAHVPDLSRCGVDAVHTSARSATAPPGAATRTDPAIAQATVDAAGAS